MWETITIATQSIRKDKKLEKSIGKCHQKLIENCLVSTIDSDVYVCPPRGDINIFFMSVFCSRARQNTLPDP